MTSPKDNEAAAIFAGYLTATIPELAPVNVPVFWEQFQQGLIHLGYKVVKDDKPTS